MRVMFYCQVGRQFLIGSLPQVSSRNMTWSNAILFLPNIVPMFADVCCFKSCCRWSLFFFHCFHPQRNQQCFHSLLTAFHCTNVFVPSHPLNKIQQGHHAERWSSRTVATRLQLAADLVHSARSADGCRLGHLAGPRGGGIYGVEERHATQCLYIHSYIYIYVCVCACMYLFHTHTYTHMFFKVYNACVIYIHMYIYIYYCVCVCTRCILKRSPADLWNTNYAVPRGIAKGFLSFERLEGLGYAAKLCSYHFRSMGKMP